MTCTSVDTSSLDTIDSFPVTAEFLNSLECSGLPCHVVRLKPNMPIMLMRNLRPSIGLCNGTRLLYRGMHDSGRLLHATIISGDDRNIGREVLLHRVDLRPDEGAFGFNWTRRQFPIKAAFAMSVNKSQGTSTCDAPAINVHSRPYLCVCRPNHGLCWCVSRDPLFLAWSALRRHVACW